MTTQGDMGAFTLALAETVMRSKKALPRGGLKSHARRLAKSTQPMPDFPAALVASLDGGPKPVTVGEGASRVVTELDARMAVKLAALGA